MHITKAEVAAAKRILFTRPRGRDDGYPDVGIRPISAAWRSFGRMPGYKSAVANVAYIWRDSDPSDQFGPMPATFAERRCELRGSGLILPASAPLWATRGYTIWKEADEAAMATGDSTEVTAWHVMLQIPNGVRPAFWPWMVTGFVELELAARGAATAWAIHALQGADDDWIVAPHAHLVVTARHWRHDSRQGQRHAGMIGSWAMQRRLEFAWRRRCATTSILPETLRSIVGISG